MGSGDNFSVRFLNDPYVSLTPIMFRSNKQGSTTIREDCTVNEFITPEWRWDVAHISAIVSREVAQVINNIPPPRSPVTDRLRFLEDESCAYSMSRAYRKLMSPTQSSVIAGSRWIWKLPCSQRIRSWCWKALKGCISMKSFLYYRGLTANLGCQHCNMYGEDLHHLILECSWSLEIWRAFADECRPVEGSLQSNSWCVQLRKLGRSRDDALRKRLCFILYTVW